MWKNWCAETSPARPERDALDDVMMTIGHDGEADDVNGDGMRRTSVTYWGSKRSTSVSGAASGTFTGRSTAR
jgi:hypothetical protein